MTLFDDFDFKNFILRHENKMKEKMRQKTLNYDSAQISSIISNIDDEMSELIYFFKLNVPELKTEQMQDPNIVPRKRRLYGGSRIVEYEAVVYTVPFEGNSDIFYCSPQGYDGSQIVVDLKSKSFLIQLDKNGMNISDDEDVKAELMSRFSQDIEIIESILEALRTELEGYLAKLKDNLKSYIHSLEKEIKKKEAKQIQKKNSESDMNPFKNE